MMECVVTNLLDEYPKHLRKNEKLYILIVCVLCYLVAIPMVCQVSRFVFLYRANKRGPKFERPVLSEYISNDVL